MRRRHWVTFLVIVLMLGVAVGAAYAQDDGGGEKKRENLLTLISYGGVIGWLLIFLNFIGLGLIVEHAITIRRSNLVPEDLFRHIEMLFEDGDFEEVMHICETQNTFLTNVLAAGLPMVGTGFENVEKAMEEEGTREATKLNQKISYINLIGNMAPMMGLLGTVTGMIAAFSQIASSDTPPPPNELAAGIQQALVTTCEGLIVAIPMLSGYFFFKNRVQRVVMEVETLASELMSRFREA